MASKTFRWALSAAVAAALMGCDKPAAPVAPASKGEPAKAFPTSTAKEQKKKGGKMATAED